MSGTVRPARIDRTTALLIASDVDGTLLDDEGQLPCSPPQLRASLHALRERVASCTLALASSRTLTELAVVQRAIGIAGPCIAEDGAVLAIDGTPDEPHLTRYGRRALEVRQHARTADMLRDIMHDVPAVARADAARLSREHLTNLGFRTPASIRRALHAREHSLLLDPSRMLSDEIVSARTVALTRSLQLRRGGRWLTLSDTQGKGPTLLTLRHLVASCGVSPLLIAIGNEENDVSLLEVADLAFVIRNPHRGPHPALTAIPHVVVLDTEGPGGWLEMLNRLQDLAR